MEKYFFVQEELYDISLYLQLSKDLVVFSSTSWDKTCDVIKRLKIFLNENEKSILAQEELMPTSEVYSEVCNEFNNYILKDIDSSLFVVPYLLTTIYNAEGHPITNVLFETIETNGRRDVFYCNNSFLRLYKNIKWIYLVSIEEVVANIEDIICTRFYARLHNCHPKDKYCLIIDDNQKMYESPSEYLKNRYTHINTLFCKQKFFYMKNKYICDLMMWKSVSTMPKLYEFVTQ